MTLRDRLLDILNNSGPSWMVDAHGILGKPTSIPPGIVRPPAPPVSAPIVTNPPSNNQSIAFVGNLGGGEKIAKAGGPDVLLKSLTSSDDSVTITTSVDGNEIDLIAEGVSEIEIANDGGYIEVLKSPPEVDEDTGVITIHARTLHSLNSVLEITSTEDLVEFDLDDSQGEIALREIVVIANGVSATMYVLGAEPVEI